VCPSRATSWFLLFVFFFSFFLFRSSLICLLPPSACLTLFFHLALPLHAVLDVFFVVLSIIWFLFRFLPSPLRPFPPALAPASSALLSL
jgi:hypothetical protein